MAGMNEQLIRKLDRLGVPLAYGDKVELGNAEVIPVAISGFGFGGGEGEGDFSDGKLKLSGASESAADAADGDDAAHRGGNGAGVGGGGFSVPIGAYVSDEFGTRFQPNIIALLIAVLPLAVVAGCTLPRLVKALKK
ncbi:MAG: hypothetical protein ACTH31_07985 [Pseudoclavibacter sp.]